MEFGRPGSAKRGNALARPASGEEKSKPAQRIRKFLLAPCSGGYDVAGRARDENRTTRRSAANPHPSPPPEGEGVWKYRNVLAPPSPAGRLHEQPREAKGAASSASDFHADTANTCMPQRISSPALANSDRKRPTPKSPSGGGSDTDKSSASNSAASIPLAPTLSISSV